MIPAKLETMRGAGKRKASAPVQGTKHGAWNLAMMAAELVWENRRARQGKKNETAQGWMKRTKKLTRSGRVAYWRPGTKAL